MDMPLSWISKLRTFTFRQDANVIELLAILAMLPLLEDLQIYELTAFTGRNVSLVNLPKLTNLGLNSCNLSSMVALLERISPAVGCCLSMFKPVNSHESYLQDARRSQAVIMRYVQNYFESRLPTWIALSCEDHVLELDETDVSRINTNCFAPPGLSIWMPFNDDDPFLIELLLNADFLSTVLELDLRRWKRDRTPFPLSAFDSVTTLWINYESLVSLSKQQGSNLPQLSVLKFGERFNGRFKEPLLSFLQHRWAIKRPISILDFSPTYDYPACDLDDLEEFTGLRVSWDAASFKKDVQEYVCGTGSPEILCFEKNHQKDETVMAICTPGHPIIELWQGWSGQISGI